MFRIRIHLIRIQHFRPNTDPCTGTSSLAPRCYVLRPSRSAGPPRGSSSSGSGTRSTVKSAHGKSPKNLIRAHYLPWDCHLIYSDFTTGTGVHPFQALGALPLWLLLTRPHHLVPYKFMFKIKFTMQYLIINLKLESVTVLLVSCLVSGPFFTLNTWSFV